jgi:hypothetical protein
MRSHPIPAFRPHRSWRSIGLLAVALVLHLAVPARAGVVVVDPQGGPGGPVLDAAIQAAHDGDILLVKPGDYVSLHPQAYELGFTSLTLVADGGGSPIVLPGVEVASLPSNRSVRLRGFELAPDETSYDRSGLAVEWCEGIVVVEDCALRGASARSIASFLPNGVGMFAANSKSVVLARCSVQGGDAGPATGQYTWPGGSGVQLQKASAALFDCTVLGGRGGDGDIITTFGSPDGGNGVLLIEAKIVVAGGSLQGGDEGDSTVIVAQPGSGLAGGFGANVDEARLRDVDVAAGNVNGLGTPAPAIDLPASMLVSHPAAARSLSLPSPLREGQAASMTLGGLQGDMVFVLASLQPAFVLDSFHQAALVVGLPSTTAVVATITDPGGQLTLPFTTPHLPAAVAGGLVVGMQAVHFGSDGVTLGAPACAVWIDDAF